MKGLIVKNRWLDEIFAGRKTWELRGSRTKTRGKIGLIESGSGTVVGTCEVIDVVGPLFPFTASCHDVIKCAGQLDT